MPILKNLPRFRSLNFVQVENRYRRKPDDPKYEPPISVKFPYRLIELLAPYQQFKRQNGHPQTFPRRSLLVLSLERRGRRNGTGDLPTVQKVGIGQDELLALCKEFLWELEKRQRPLCEFFHLFAIEALIVR